MPRRPRATVARERLRKRYGPKRVRILFVGEAPPASGRFFYRADSGLYRAVRDTFTMAFSTLDEQTFLAAFRAMGCYLVDLCGRPVDRLSRNARKKTCRASESSLAKKLRRLRPKIIITVVRSIAPNVRRAEQEAKWSGRHIELPYPGRWHQHRAKFLHALVRLLREKIPRKNYS